MSENAIKTPKKDKRFWLLILGAAVGIFLLVFGSIGVKKQESSEEAAASSSISEMDPDAFAQSVEDQVTKICSQVKGAGRVSVVVTLKGGYRAVYATDSQSTGSGYKNSTVLTGSGSSEGAVLVCYENPEIGGIGIVCDGGDDPLVRQSVVSLVAAAFNVGTNKIYVAAG
ncbi:MAG: hypothetical protein IJW44_04230 [Clostridia bacterium]|nr:hypothetical protein [Clostridia bacterium]